MSANFHPLVYLIDYVMGMIMWTLIGRVAMNIFQREDSEFFFMKVLLSNIKSQIGFAFLMAQKSQRLCAGSY